MHRLGFLNCIDVAVLVDALARQLLEFVSLDFWLNVSVIPASLVSSLVDFWRGRDQIDRHRGLETLGHFLLLLDGFEMPKILTH